MKVLNISAATAAAVAVIDTLSGRVCGVCVWSLPVVVVVIKVIVVANTKIK